MHKMELFRTILRSQKNELNADPLPASPVLTRLSSSPMMSAMSLCTTSIRVALIVVNATIARIGARQET